MRRLLLVTLVLFLALPALVVGVGSFLPREARVERARTVPAAPAAVRAVLEDLRTWPEWSAWTVTRASGHHAHDPEAIRRAAEPGSPPTVLEVEGATMSVAGDPGPGQVWRWDGEGEMGHGSMEVVRDEPLELVYDIAARGEDTEHHTRLTATLEPDGEGTRVRWTFEGAFDGVLMRWILVSGQYDAWLGEDLEHSLEGLEGYVAARTAAEDPGAPAPTDGGADGERGAEAGEPAGAHGDPAGPDAAPEGPAGSAGDGHR